MFNFTHSLALFLLKNSFACGTSSLLDEKRLVVGFLSPAALGLGSGAEAATTVPPAARLSLTLSPLVWFFGPFLLRVASLHFLRRFGLEGWFGLQDYVLL